MIDSIDVAEAVLAAKGLGQDRVAVFRTQQAVVIALADGAGGMGGGTAAAEHALHLVVEAAQQAGAGAGPAWVPVLTAIDAALTRGAGQCALVVAAIVGGRILGASVGDCGAWLIGASMIDLTAPQIRKPLVGSGSAVPVAFEAELGAGTLLLASDGLFKYASRDRIISVAQKADLQSAARELVELPRLRSGALPDDVAVVLCRSRV